MGKSFYGSYIASQVIMTLANLTNPKANATPVSQIVRLWREGRLFWIKLFKGEMLARKIVMIRGMN